MSHCVVRLNGTEEVEEFVKAASKCDFDIDIFYNRVIIDAKSILGILSMDLTKVLTVTWVSVPDAFVSYLSYKIWFTINYFFLFVNNRFFLYSLMNFFL